jgi:hypothetical protein
MSPEHDNCRLPAHYLAKLIVHLSHISGNSARYNIRDVFLDRQGKRMLIPGIQDRFPENSKKNEKAASSICAGKEIYLTNEGIGAILPIDPNNLGRYSTINPFEVSMVIIDPGTQ